MDNNELFAQLLIEVIKLVVSGILGGAVVSFFNYRLLRNQKKLEAKQEIQNKRLDALRNIDSLLHWLVRDIFYNWEKPIKKDQLPDEYIVELVNNLHYWETLFLGDEKMSNALRKLSSLIGVSKEEVFGRDANKKNLGEFIDEIRKIIREKINELQLLR